MLPREPLSEKGRERFGKGEPHIGPAAATHPVFRRKSGFHGPADNLENGGAPAAGRMKDYGHALEVCLL